MNDAAAGLGHNKPPIKVELEARYPEIFRRIDELEALSVTVPEKLRNDDEAGKAQDLVKMMRVAIKQADSTRDVEKEPYAQAVKEVNATFKIPMERLEKVQKAIMGRIDRYLEEKKEAERLAREEAARKQREEAERLAREAEAAEHRRIEAERQRQEEEARARRAAEEAERQKREAREAEERAAAARAEAARLEVERKAREAAAAKRREVEAEQAEARRLQAEAERKAHEQRMAALKAEREASEKAAAEARAAAEAARQEKLAAEAAAKTAKGEARDAARDTTAALGQAVRAEKRADRLDDAAQASDADLARTRGELGTVGTMAKRWTYRVDDYDAVPLDRLRPFLARDAIDAAVYRLMQTGVRELPGVIFEQISEARVA